MTINECKQERKSLEEGILKLIQVFEDKTSLFLRSINLHHLYTDAGKKQTQGLDTDIEL